MPRGIGRAIKRALEVAVRVQGQTIIIHLNTNTPEATSSEARGLKTTATNRSSQVIFQFLELLDIPVGAVLQVKGSRDYWRVTDTEDIVQDDTFINCEVRVEKINISGQPTRPRAFGGTTYNLHGTHSRVNIQSEDHSVNISQQITENVFAEMRQLIQTEIQHEDERTEILGRLNALEEAKGSNNFLQRYQEFIAAAANHITLFGPFIPALTQMLTS